MATITPGGGGTIKSTTAEGQLMEVLSFISLNQAIAARNPAGVTNVTGTHNQQSLIYSGTYRFDVTQTINSAGHLELEAQPFLVGANFQVGSSGTFKGNSPEKYALEVLMYLQNLENTPGLNPQNRNFVSGTYNSDNQRYEGSFSIPVTFSLNPTTGVISYGANPYLL